MGYKAEAILRLVGRVETQNRLIPHLHVAFQHLKNSSAVEIPRRGVKGSSPTPRLPDPGFQYQEEEFPQNLAVKISGDSDYPSETEVAGNPDIPLKGLHTDSMAYIHSPWASAEGQQIGKYKRFTEKD